MYTHQTLKQCGQNTYNSINCTNKIRKVSQNKFENVSLVGKHAFNYTVLIQNKSTKTLKAVSFPTRKEAIVFFTLTIKKYD